MTEQNDIGVMSHRLKGLEGNVKELSNKVDDLGSMKGTLEVISIKLQNGDHDLGRRITALEEWHNTTMKAIYVQWVALIAGAIIAGHKTGII